MEKILIIGHTNLMGGVETFIYNTVINSNPSKVQFYFLIHGYSECVYQKEITEFYCGENHFFFIPKIKRNPVKTLIILTKFYSKYKNMFKYIHLQTGSASEIVYCFPFCYLAKSKLIIHSHNGGNSKSGVLNMALRPLINMAASKKIACSDIAAHFLFGNHVTDYEIINNGIDTERFKFDEKNRSIIRKKFGIGDSQIVLGHIGRFSKQKNHEKLIDIFSSYSKIYNSVLLLVGTGELEDQIKEKVHKLGLDDKVIFAGVQMETEKYYSAMDVFVMPSYYEGLPIVGVEAQCNGLGCVFSKNISDQVLLSPNSIKADISSSETEWVQCIEKSMVALEDRYKGKKYIEDKNYSIRKIVNRLQEIYLS